jgi:hypothetical protein
MADTETGQKTDQCTDHYLHMRLLSEETIMFKWENPTEIGNQYYQYRERLNPEKSEESHP